MNTKFADYTFSAKLSSGLLLAEAGHLEMLIKNQIFRCVEQCYSSEDESYYRSIQDQKCEERCIETYNTNITKLQTSGLQRLQKECEECLIKCTSAVGPDYIDARMCSERCHVELRESVFSILKSAVAQLKQ